MCLRYSELNNARQFLVGGGLHTVYWHEPTRVNRVLLTSRSPFLWIIVPHSSVSTTIDILWCSCTWINNHMRPSGKNSFCSARPSKHKELLAVRYQHLSAFFFPTNPFSWVHVLHLAQFHFYCEHNKMICYLNFQSPSHCHLSIKGRVSLVQTSQTECPWPG